MIVIIGLGSMGKRRIRCLQALGYKDIIGFDPREDRRNEAKENYGIDTTTDIMVQTDDIGFICTPPKLHRYYSDMLGERKHFIEAGTELLEHGTPSATMLFNPLVKDIRAKLPEIGNLINISYHCGQYLPDWHTYEKVSEFYAAEAGAIEMVGFELMWIMKVFGYLLHSTSQVRSGKEIEGLNAPDSIAFNGEFENNALVSVVIDVVSRTAIRQLVINGTEKQLRYDLNQGVSEQMYIDETKAFMEGDYPNTLEHSNKIIEITKQLCA